MITVYYFLEVYYYLLLRLSNIVVFGITKLDADLFFLHYKVSKTIVNGVELRLGEDECNLFTVG